MSPHLQMLRRTVDAAPLALAVVALALIMVLAFPLIGTDVAATEKPVEEEPILSVDDQTTVMTDAAPAISPLAGKAGEEVHLAQSTFIRQDVVERAVIVAPRAIDRADCAPGCVVRQTTRTYGQVKERYWFRAPSSLQQSDQELMIRTHPNR